MDKSIEVAIIGAITDTNGVIPVIGLNQYMIITGAINERIIGLIVGQ